MLLPDGCCAACLLADVRQLVLDQPLALTGFRLVGARAEEDLAPDRVGERTPRLDRPGRRAVGMDPDIRKAVTQQRLGAPQGRGIEARIHQLRSGSLGPLRASRPRPGDGPFGDDVRLPFEAFHATHPRDGRRVLAIVGALIQEDHPGSWSEIHACLPLVSLAVLVGLTSPAIAAEKVPVLIDTDIGNDVDDAFALALAVNSPELDLRHHRLRGRE